MLFNEFYINKCIKSRNFQKLSEVFQTNKIKFNSHKILEPYNKIFDLQYSYVKSRNYFNSELVLKSLNSILDEGEDIHCIIKVVVRNCINELKAEHEVISLIKNLIELYQSYTVKYFITNILFKLYFMIEKYELAYNLLLISSNDRKKKRDYYIYNMYKGILLLYKGNIEECSVCMNICYKSQYLRKKIFFLYFIINLLNNKFIADKYIKKYLRDQNMENIFPNITVDSYTHLKNVIKYGLVSHVKSSLCELQDVLSYYNIDNICNTYMPLVCFTNLVKRIFHMCNEDHKLNIKYIEECLDMEYEEIISLICSVIDNNMIKGYISINKNVMVFSRKDPFPSVYYK